MNGARLWFSFDLIFRFDALLLGQVGLRQWQYPGIEAAMACGISG